MGMSTLDDSYRDFTLKDSGSALVGGSTQKTQEGGTTDEGTVQGTGAFGMKPFAPRGTGKHGFIFQKISSTK